MAILSSIGAALGSSLSTALASKGAVAAGAAVLMVGGGVAVAQSGPALDHADEISPAEPTSLVPGDEHGDTIVDVQDAGTNDEQNREDETTSERVHRALTSDADDDDGDIRPGHPKFGATVAERAQDEHEHLGEIVSDAARGDNGTNGDDNRTETAQNGEGAAPPETPAERTPEELPEQSPGELPNQASDGTDELPEEAPEAPPEHAPGPPEEPGPDN